MTTQYITANFSNSNDQLNVETVVAGTTRIINATFRLNGALIDLDNVTVTIYDKWRGELQTFITGITNTSTGVYKIPYTFPSEYDEVSVEFKGFYEGKPQITRKAFSIVWLDPLYD